MLKALSRIKHDGQVYEAGDVLPALSERDTEAFIAGGIVEEVKEQSKSEQRRVAVQKAAKKDQTPDADSGSEDSKNETPNKRWNKPQLLEYARANGIEVNDEMVKDEILAAINAGASEEDESSEDEDATDSDTDESDK